MAEKQLNTENMSKQDVNQTSGDIKNDNANGMNQGQSIIGKQNKGAPPSAPKMYLPGFIKRKCTTLGPNEQRPSMPKQIKMEPQLTPNIESTKEEPSMQQPVDPEPTEPEATQSEQIDPESTNPNPTEQEPNNASDTDSDSSDSEADEPEPRPRVMTDPDFDAAVASVFTPMEPAVVVETLPVITEPSTLIFTPMESDMLDIMPRPPPRSNAVAGFAFAPVQLLETLEPRQRVAYCYCRRRADLDRLIRAKRRRELMMVRKPPLVLTCRAYEHGVEAILSNSIQSEEESIISSDLRTFVVAERLHTALDKSVSALIFGIKRYHKLLKGKRFTIVTDQPAFVKVFHPATLFQVVPEKWEKIATALSLFNYNIIYRPSPPKRTMSPSLMLMI